MGCVNGKPVLTEEDLEFIATHTAISREEVDQQYDHFLQKHPVAISHTTYLVFCTKSFGENLI
jgi:hypothetical protein